MANTHRITARSQRARRNHKTSITPRGCLSPSAAAKLIVERHKQPRRQRELVETVRMVSTFTGVHPAYFLTKLLKDTEKKQVRTIPVRAHFRRVSVAA